MSEWPGECHAIDWFCRNVVGPPEWEHEAMSSVVWIQCTNLSRVYNLSIAASSDMDTVRSRSHRGSTDIINLHTKIHKMAHADMVIEDHYERYESDQVRITLVSYKRWLRGNPEMVSWSGGPWQCFTHTSC